MSQVYVISELGLVVVVTVLVITIVALVWIVPPKGKGFFLF